MLAYRFDTNVSVKAGSDFPRGSEMKSRVAIAAAGLLALLAPSPLFAKNQAEWLVALASTVERQALRGIDLPDARARLAEAGRAIRSDGAAGFDSCLARVEARTLAKTVEVVLDCARFARLAVAARATKEAEFARLLVAFSGFPQDKFLNAVEVEQLMKRTSPSNGVIGLGLAVNDGKIAVVQSFRGSPAREAGIGPGWQLLSIDGRAYSGAERDNAARALAGEVGSTISLGLVDPQGIAREISLGRIEAARIDWDIDSQRSGETLTVQVYSINRGARDKVEALINEGREAPSRIVLDLRGNPGGTLDEAIALADVFLDRGRIATVRGRRGVEQIYDADRAAIAPNAQITVLVDKETAAGAELLAAALADNARATVLGEQTRGMGTIRTLLPYKRDAAVVLTTQEFLRPDGEPIEGRGVQPAGPA